LSTCRSPFFNISSSGIHHQGHGVTFSTHVVEVRTSPTPVFYYNIRTSVVKPGCLPFKATIPAAASDEQHRRVSKARASLRCHIGLVIVRKIQERQALSGGNAAAINQGQPMRELVQPVPYTGGVPGDFYIRGLIRAPHAAVLCFCCAGLFAWRIYLCFMEVSHLT